MNKSDELEQEAAFEDNDIKAFALYAKAERERRIEGFREWFLPILSEHFQIEYTQERECFRFKMKHHDDLLFDFYPKGDKVHYHRPIKWVRNGLNHIVSKLPKSVQEELKKQ